MNMQITPWGLAFPERLPDGSWRVVTAVGTECATEQAAQTLLFDRTANGDAFPGEFVQAPVAHQLTPEQSSDNKTSGK